MLYKQDPEELTNRITTRLAAMHRARRRRQSLMTLVAMLLLIGLLLAGAAFGWMWTS